VDSALDSGVDIEESSKQVVTVAPEAAREVAFYI